ncbi:hypothetical protein ZIOFF_040297 [Zingiber officinale]|uniref:Uncharacterized protein n=1 Tax=Zingiber officinale TaxID=94328 RepID=A0A8J5GBU4_ZINOF|nr:hypothetical protein ZIOFF_040297 [Zingiber officinale]
MCISLPSSYSRYFLPHDSAKVFVVAAVPAPVPAAVFYFVDQIHPITDDEPLTSASSFQLHSKGNLRLLPVENEAMTSSQSQQRKRGKTIMRDIHALHPDHVLVVEFNERGQPYGDLQSTLANFIRTITQNGLVLPSHFLDWKKMPANRLNDAWKLVTACFYIPNHHRRVIMQMMGVAWRRWRTEVKATSYDSNTPLEELVAIQPIPHGLTPQTWEVLCNYWKSTESQENGRKPSRIEIQQLSWRSRKKGGAAIDDEAIRIEMEAMFANIMQQQVPSPAEEDRCRSSSSPESDNN